jgi:CheY-like chemotaxis protein
MAGPKTIAIVNHDPVFLRLVDVILENGGYNPVTCPSGTSAHDVIVRLQPDLVMIDTWLETRDQGWLIVQTLRLDEATLSIPILLTSSDPDGFQHRSLEVAAMTNMLILPKPFDPESLLLAAERILSAEWNPGRNALFYSRPGRDQV